MRKSLLFVVLFCAVVVVVGLPCFLIKIGDLRSYQVPTSSMKQTLVPGDRFWMERLSYRFRKPRRGEIIVFRTAGIADIPQPTPPEPSPIFVMRIIGLPKDTIQLHGENLLVNGKPDPALAAFHFHFNPQAVYLGAAGSTVRVPEDSYFVIGDNTNKSFDSRYWGFVPAKNIIARAAFRYSPFRHAGFL